MSSALRAIVSEAKDPASSSPQIFRALGALRTMTAWAMISAPRLMGQQPEFDVLIAGGTVIDGSGTPRYAADVALKGDRIALISRSPISAQRAARVIDAK